MDSSTGSDLIVTLAWRSAQVAGFAAALLLFFSLLVRRYFRYEARLHARVIVTWRPLLTRIAIEAEPSPALPSFPRRHLAYLMEEWNALNDSVRGDAGERLNAAALALGLDTAVRRHLHSRQVGRRILAIHTLGSEVAIELLRRHPEHAGIVAAALVVVLEPSVLPELARFAQSPDAEVRRNLAIAYGHLGRLDDMETATRLMCDPVSWVRYRAGQALLSLKGMTPERLEAVAAHLTDKYARDMLAHVRAEAAIP